MTSISLLILVHFRPNIPKRSNHIKTASALDCCRHIYTFGFKNEKWILMTEQQYVLWWCTHVVQEDIVNDRLSYLVPNQKICVTLG